ncbi:MAG TPA: hypothetical protein VEB21_14945 [Terriglobales bacterium]|nr:hypothetical protein [Terriglobales bacterium]
MPTCQIRPPRRWLLAIALTLSSALSACTAAAPTRPSCKEVSTVHTIYMGSDEQFHYLAYSSPGKAHDLCRLERSEAQFATEHPFREREWRQLKRLAERVRSRTPIAAGAKD